MRISDWSSDVCSSDLTNTQATSVPNTALISAPISAEPKLRRSAASTRGEKITSIRPCQPRFDDLKNTPVSGISTIRLRYRMLNPSDRPKPGITERRSEEHTSELQSLMRNSYAVFCLKKKKKTRR